MIKYRKPHNPKDLVKEKVPLTNIIINRDFSRYESALKNFKPDHNTSEIFKEVFENSDLKISEIDEIRKIFYLYFKQHVDLISEYKLVKVKIDTLGTISPNIDEICNHLERLSKGFTMTNITHNKIVDHYNNLLLLLKKLIEDHKYMHRKINQEHLIKYDTKFLEIKNKQWKRNFHDRNIRFKEVLISDGLFF